MEDNARSPLPAAGPLPPASRLPLEGVRVLSLTGVWAGPFAEQILADWGAEVIRLESTQFFQPNTRGRSVRPTGEVPLLRRGWGMGYPDWRPGEQPWNRYAMFQCHARNKLSMTVDLLQPEGLDILHRLLRISDVFMENNVPETTEKLHLSYEELREVKRDIIAVRMPAYGLSGPYKDYRSFGAQLDGAIGHTWLRGYPDADVSMRNDVFLPDAVAGLHGAVAVMMALQQRRRTGKGQLVELALAESTLPCLAEALLDCTMNGRVHSALGNRHPSRTPQGVYACQGDDGWIALSVGTESEWDGLCRAMGEPAWCKLPQFATSLARWKHQDELDRNIGVWTKGLTPRQAFEMLQAAGVPAGPVMNERDLYEDPQLEAQEYFETLTHEDAGTHSYPGLMWKAERTPNRLRTPPCRLGEHNEYVYRRLLRLSDDEIQQLKAAGHIGTEYASHLR